MELLLIRTYYTNGANGTILVPPGMTAVVNTIELPWKGNQHGISCIPEGRYGVHKRYTPKRGWHLILEGVPGRSLILVHPANDAIKELEGCIAPVTVFTGEGKGSGSRAACEKLLRIVCDHLEREPVYLTIKSMT